MGAREFPHLKGSCREVLVPVLFLFRDGETEEERDFDLAQVDDLHVGVGGGVEPEKSVGGERGRGGDSGDGDGDLVAVLAERGDFPDGGIGRVHPDADFGKAFLFGRCQFDVGDAAGMAHELLGEALVMDVEEGGGVQEALLLVARVLDVHLLHVGHVGVDDFSVIVVFHIHEVQAVEVAFHPGVSVVRLFDSLFGVFHGKGENHFGGGERLDFGSRLVEDFFCLGGALPVPRRQG